MKHLKTFENYSNELSESLRSLGKALVIGGALSLSGCSDSDNNVKSKENYDSVTANMKAAGEKKDKIDRDKKAANYKNSPEGRKKAKEEKEDSVYNSSEYKEKELKRYKKDSADQSHRGG